MRNTLLMVAYLLIASGLVLVVISVVFSLNKRAADSTSGTTRLKPAGDSFIDEPVAADSVAHDPTRVEASGQPTPES